MLDKALSRALRLVFPKGATKAPSKTMCWKSWTALGTTRNWAQQDWATHAGSVEVTAILGQSAKWDTTQRPAWEKIDQDPRNEEKLATRRRCYHYTHPLVTQSGCWQGRVIRAYMPRLYSGQVMSCDHWHGGITEKHQARHHCTTAQERTDSVLQMASGETFPVLKEAMVQLTLQWHHPRTCMFVPKITDKFILGLDILCTHDEVKNLGPCVLWLGKEELALLLLGHNQILLPIGRTAAKWYQLI
jgi:hypothetical protein